MLEADNEPAARTQLASLPLVRANMMLVDALVPLAPYPGFGPRN